MEKKNNTVTSLANIANDVYAKVKKDTMLSIKGIQERMKLSDDEMCLILGLTEKDFSALMDERLYYVIKVDTLIRIHLLLNRCIITLKKPEKGDIDIIEFVQRFKQEEINDSVQRLLDTLGIKTADEINCFTDFLLQNAAKFQNENSQTIKIRV